MDKRVIAAIILVLIILGSALFFSGFFDKIIERNIKPDVQIAYPNDGASVAELVMISGTASDPDGQITIVELQVGNGGWIQVDGTTLWSYEWSTYDVEDGAYAIQIRAFDSIEYSDVESITVQVRDAQVESPVHKWAVFVAAANFPQDNMSKLGNGGLNLAEDIASYLIESAGYPSENIVILFDDGWIRDENGYGERIETLQERRRVDNIVYGAATKQTVVTVLGHMIEESNQYEDSEVFLWVFGHGYGDENRSLFGGKLLQKSEVFLWDGLMSDQELGDMLDPLESKKVCVIVDACYAGGFADKTIFDLPTSFLLRSRISQTGRIVISSTSKFRRGVASTTEGPLFTQLWFEGLSSGEADGYKGGIFDLGRPMRLRFFKNEEASVEESFYYAKYMLRTDENLREYKEMAPQMNDRYPRRGLFLLNRGEMVLG